MASEIKMKMSLITSGVKTALTGMKTSIANFSREASEKLNQVAKVATAGLVAGFVAGARSALTYGKEMKNLANIAGTSFEEFQKLAYGAKTVGIESDKLADIYKDVNDKIGDFTQNEAGPMVDFFDKVAPKVGITADAFKNLSGPEALQLYYDSIEKANLTQAEMTFYMEAIASDATALVPLLQKGGDQFRILGDEALQGGAVMARETADNLDKAQQAIDKFKQQAVIKIGDIIGGAGDNAGIKQLGAQFMVLMGKLGQWMINAFLGAVKTLTMAMTATAILFGEKLLQGFEFATAKLTVLMAPVIESIAKMMGFEVKLDTSGAKKKLEDISNAVPRSFVDIFYEVGDSLGNWNFEFDEQIGYWKKIAEEQGVILKTQKDLDEFIRKMKGGVTDANGKYRIQKELLEAELALFGEIDGENYDIIRALERQISDYKDILGLMEKHDISAKEATGHVDKKNEGLKRQQALVDALNKAEAEGDTRTYTAIKLQLDLHEQAYELQEKTGKSYNDAYDTVYKIYTLKEGDLDLSGDISKEEKVLHKRKIKILEEQKKIRKEVEKTESVLRVKLLPNWKDVRKQSEDTYDSLKSSSDIHNILHPKVRKVKDEQEKVTTAVDNTNYEHLKTSTILGSTEEATDGVAGAEDAVTDAVGRSNAQRQEAIRLTEALKNAGGAGSMDINVKTKIGADLSEYLVPHLEKHTELLTSIDTSLKC